MYSVIIVLHLLCWAIVFGLSFTGMKQCDMPKGLLHGAIGALLTGLILVVLKEMGDGDVNHMKIGIKLLVALAVTGLAFWGGRKDELKPGYFGLLAGLVAANVAIAVLV